MGIKRILTLAAASFLLIAGICIFMEKQIQAQGDGPDPKISGKLDEILKNQKAMIQDMEAIKSELNIIKIRITQQQ